MRWSRQGHILSLVRQLEQNHGRSRRSPTLATRLAHLVGLQVPSSDNVTRLTAFRADCESMWGRGVTSIDDEDLEDGELFALHKTLALARLGRTPKDVTEGFVTATGSVDGVRIEPRQIFWQRFRPCGRPNGRMVLISPRYGENGRHYYGSISALNRQGYDVVIMDHQWAGQTIPNSPRIDRGFGVTRDVAAMAAAAAKWVEADYGYLPGSELILVGKAMGASAGVLGALVMNDNGRLKLDGSVMPKGLNAVLLTPWLGATRSLRSQVRRAARHVPVFSRLAVYRGHETSVRIDSPRALRATLRAVDSAMPDLRRLRQVIADGARPLGRLYVLHCARDPYVDPDRSAWLARLFGSRMTLRLVDMRYSSSVKIPFMTDYVVDALNALVTESLRSITSEASSSS